MKRKIYTQSEKVEDLGSKAETSQLKSAIGTLLIVLSGLVLYLDKLFVYFDITLDNLYGWPSTGDLVWAVCQTVSPLLILVAAFLRPYIFGVVVPCFCYALQLGFVFDANMAFDDHLVWVYLVGSIILVLVVIYSLKKRLEDLNFLKEMEYQNAIDENILLKKELERLKNKAA